MSKVRLKAIDLGYQRQLLVQCSSVGCKVVGRSIAIGSLAVGGFCFGLSGFGLSGTVAIAQSSAPTNPEPLDRSSPAATEPIQRPDQPLLQLGSSGPAVVEVQAMLSLLGFYTDPVDGQFGSSTAIAVTQFQTAAGLVADGIVGPGTWSRLLPTPERLAENNSENNAEAAENEDESAASEVPERSPFPIPESLTRQNTSEDAPQNSANTSEPPSSVDSSQSSGGDRSPSSAESSPRVDASVNVGLPILRQGMQGSAVAALQERLRVLGIFSGVVDGVFGPQTEAAVMAAQRRFRLSPDGVVGAETWTALLGS